ncbi:RNA polymerase subunit sigma-70 [Nocardioides insulae]|uniref:RNA polymerase subunit sigma-70 n=1 Tax=Nocardioides insulae TaxID=394734 RepID=UPI00042046C3|nr:RNA polymerase subunit sigma-70 [Nocardioides insulae]
MTTVDFATAAEQYRAALEVHCYRMLGSVHDAEDAVQETLLRAWAAADRLEPDSNVRAWLYRIATNRCLTLIERRRRRELPVDLSPGATGDQVAWLEPHPAGNGAGPVGPEATYDATDSMTLAFVALLQHLPGRQRAALILRDVLGFNAAEAAEVLTVSVPALNSALQRARAKVAGRLPPPEGPDDEVARVAALYARAWEQGDVDAILALLDADAEYSMPPLPQWFRGHDAIRGFLLDGPLGPPGLRWRFIGVRANEQTAFGTYARADERGAYGAVALDVIRVRGGLVTEVVSFLTPEVFGRFGLPAEIAASER